MRRDSRIRHRRAFAATAALLWLLGVEVLPDLHLATHHHDHTHAADGSIVRVDDGHHDHAHPHHAHVADFDHDDFEALGIAHEHIDLGDEQDDVEHGDVAHDDHHDHDVAVDEVAPCEHTTGSTRRHRRDREQLAIDHDVPAGHAALGIAHHATALHQPAPPLLAPVATPNVETWTYPAPNERVSSAERARPTARGPPVA